ncbi:MAG: flagellar alpha dynein [Microcoleus anatoxicus]|uniref:flagellar alpha dynein n=1 Tax=Microcoleus anatoxicus TaxID=2705319 RepID=UPI00367353D3
MRSQLETERTRWDELQEELDDREEICAQLRSQLSDLKQKSVTASEFPESADLLNQLKGRRKKSKADLADIDAILGVLVAYNG